MLAGSSLLRVVCFLCALRLSPAVSGRISPLTGAEDVVETVGVGRKRLFSSVEESKPPPAAELPGPSTDEHPGCNMNNKSTSDRPILSDLTISSDTKQSGGVHNHPIMIPDDVESQARATESHPFIPLMDTHYPVFDRSRDSFTSKKPHLGGAAVWPDAIPHPSSSNNHDPTSRYFSAREWSEDRAIQKMKSINIGDPMSFHEKWTVKNQPNPDVSGKKNADGSNYNMDTNSDSFQWREKGAKFWAWISMLWEGTPGIIIDEAHNRSNHLASKLEQAISQEFEHYVQKNPKKSGGESNHGSSLHSRLVYFVNTLWGLNHRVLDLWGAEVGSEIYLGEQDAIQRWALNLLLVNQDAEMIECLHDGHFHSYITPKSTRIREFLFRYLLSDKNKPAYHVPSNNFDNSALEVSERDVLLIKAVKNAMGNYYKTQNKRKWLEVFVDEEYFLHRIARIQRYISIRQYNRYKTRQSSNEISILIPWKARLESDFVRIGFTPEDERGSWIACRLNRIIKSLAYDRYVEVPKLRSLVPVQVGKVDIFDMGKLSPKVWAWISMIKVYKQDADVMEDELRLNVWKGRGFEDLRNKAFPDTLFDHIKVALDEKTDEFLKVLWLYHSILLQLCGRKVSEPAYFEEQKELQEWVLKQFDSKSEASNNGSEKVDKSSIARFLVSTGEKIIYQTYKFSPVKSKDPAELIRISKSDIQLTEGVIYALGSYYKRKNPGKWKTVFQEDHNLCSMFFNLQCKIFSGKLEKDHHDYFDQVGTINLMPWEEGVGKLEPKEIEKIKKESPFQRPRNFKLDLDKWLLDYERVSSV